MLKKSNWCVIMMITVLASTWSISQSTPVVKLNNNRQVFVYISQNMPDFCSVFLQVRRLSEKFSPPGQKIIREFVDSLERSVRAELSSLYAKKLRELKSLGPQKFKKIMEILSLSFMDDKNNICSLNDKLLELLIDMNQSQAMIVRQFFDLVRDTMENKLPDVLSKSFADNSDKINQLTATDPEGIKLIGPLMSQFLRNALGFFG